MAYSEPKITNIDFGNLSVVEIDYIEMERQMQRISELSSIAQENVSSFKESLIKLADLLSVEVPEGLDQIEERINKIGIYGDLSSDTIIGKMQRQINLFKSQNNEISQRIKYLTSIIESGRASDGGWDYENLTYNGVTMNYNDILQMNEIIRKHEGLLGILNITEEELAYMINTDPSTLSTTNFYQAIETNYGLEAGEGKIIVDELLSQIQNNPDLSNREKAVQTALALNNLCYQNGVKFPYVGTNYHKGYTLDVVSVNSDCSSFVTYLLKQGNADITGGGTGWLTNSTQNPYISEASGGLTDLQPGDIIVRNGWGSPYDHAMFFIGYDENGGLICTENYGGTETWNSSGTKISVYNAEDLYGYKGYNVDYGDKNTETL